MYVTYSTYYAQHRGGFSNQQGVEKHLHVAINDALVQRSDGSAMQSKGKQFVPHGQKVIMAFPGGAGYGDPAERDPEMVKRDLERGYISAEVAKRDYGADV